MQNGNGKAHPLQVTLYAGVSTRDQTAENELQDLRRYATARGFAVVGEHVDVGVSGAKEQRPGLGDLGGQSEVREDAPGRPGPTPGKRPPRAAPAPQAVEPAAYGQTCV